MARFFLLLLCMLLSSCAGKVTSESSGRESLSEWKDQIGITALDRVAYVGGFTTPADLGYRSGFSERFKRLLGGTGEPSLVRPYTIAEDRQLMVITDPGAGVVVVMNKEKGRYDILGASDSLMFGSPVGVALVNGEIFVADSALGKLFKFNKKLELIQTLDQFVRPTSLAFNQHRQTLYVSDTGAHALIALDVSGKTLFRFGERGAGEGQFNYPTHISLMKDQLLVVDSLNFRVQFLSLDGVFLGQFGIHGDQPGQFAQPKGIATDSDGHIYIAESVSGLVQIFNTDGTFLGAFGNHGREPGSFILPAGIMIRENDIFVADSGNGRVQQFRYLGDQK